ncbi:hypothetical protein G6F22_014986 [Rhizopus arrhizus]|nr:hypothetical protein G6F22_014986 [Rhizopus arrhizus]
MGGASGFAREIGAIEVFVHAARRPGLGRDGQAQLVIGDAAQGIAQGFVLADPSAGHEPGAAGRRIGPQACQIAAIGVAQQQVDRHQRQHLHRLAEVGLVQHAAAAHIAARPSRHGRAGDDQQVHPERPVLDVVDVVLDAVAHLAQRVRLPPEPVDLGPARNARLDPVAHHVALHQVLVHFVVLQRVRAGPDDGHVAHQHVQELRQLIQAGAPQEAADAGNAGIVAGRLRDRAMFLMHGHGAELVDVEHLAVHAQPRLGKENGATGRQLHHQGDGDHQG